MIPTEREIQDAIKDYLERKGYYVMRLNSGKFSVGEAGNRRFIKGQEAGTPDLLAIKHGICHFIEVKRPKNKPTLMQVLKMQELKRFGAFCFVAHSVDEVIQLGL